MKINYTLNINNIITSYTVIPFNEELPTLEVSEEELKKIKVGYTKIVDNKLIFNDDIYLNKVNIKKELAEIQKWFFDNDWKINKIVIGEWTKDDERWTTYLEERQIKRNRQDELNQILNSNL